MVRPRLVDFGVAIAFALAALVEVRLGVDNPILKAVIGGPLVLVLPGFALTMALFPGWSYGRAVLLLVSAGLSLACAALGGLILQLLPGGIGAESWTIFFAVIVLAGSCIAILRDRAGVGFPSSDRLVVRQRDIALFAGALVLVSGAVWLARVPAPQAPDQAYSVLWALPVSEDGTTIRVGVESAEREPTNYIVRVLESNQQVQEFNVALAPTGTWQTELALLNGRADTVEVDLSKADSPDDVYRRVAVRTGA